MTELATRAIIFAAEAHDGMRRKQSDCPYILHPMEAAVIVGTMTSNQEVIAAAALHDVVEDAGITMREVGGLGIYIVKQTMDTVTYARENGENILTMTKKLERSLNK